MPIRKIARMGHPVLREKAAKINPKQIESAEIKSPDSDLIDSMEEYSGIGIAAPQIHESKRWPSFAWIRVLQLTRCQWRDAITVFINPEIKVIDDKKQEFWEGCLSVLVFAANWHDRAKYARGIFG
ncbi:MAG: peptide deformylase [Bdellovibrionota bacterium]